MANADSDMDASIAPKRRWSPITTESIDCKHERIKKFNRNCNHNFTMSILVKPDTKVLVQGITGSFGARHAQLSH